MLLIWKWIYPIHDGMVWVGGYVCLTVSIPKKYCSLSAAGWGRSDIILRNATFHFMPNMYSFSIVAFNLFHRIVCIVRIQLMQYLFYF